MAVEKEELLSGLLERLESRRYNKHRGGAHKEEAGKRRGDGDGFILAYLVRHGGTALPGEICQAMGVSTPRVAVLLRSLEEDGMITRTVVADDRRKVCFTLTDRGRVMVEKKQRRREDFLRRLLEELSDEDAAALPRILDALEKVWKESREHDGSSGQN